MAVAHTFLTPASLSLLRGASCWLFRFLTQTRREPFYLFFFSFLSRTESFYIMTSLAVTPSSHYKCICWAISQLVNMNVTADSNS